MSLLILAVGWAYTQICRIYPDGGGVYTAAKSEPTARRSSGAAAVCRLHRHRLAQRARRVSLLRSALHQTQVERPIAEDPDRTSTRRGHEQSSIRTSRRRAARTLFAWNSPGLWAIVAIRVIGMFNLMGPKHTGGFAIFAAVGMVVITLLIVGFALPQMPIGATAPSISALPTLITSLHICGWRSCRSCWRCRASKRSPTSPA